MTSGKRSLGTSLAVTLLLQPALLSGQDKKPAVPDKAPAAKEMLLKGTLTALEQEITHIVPLQRDQAYSITADSRGFFTHVQIEDGQGNKLMPPSGSLSYKAPHDGPFRLLVSSPGGSCGQYVVSVRPITLTTTAPGEVLTVGAEGLSVEAVLTKEDPLDKVRKKHCRPYDVRMSGGKTYVIDLISKQFDAFLRLEDAAGKELGRDDDSGGANNARIRFKPPADGVYRIIATSFGLETGLFQLKVKEE
jgi:hypothetical protein